MATSAFLLFALNHRYYGIQATAVQEIFLLPAVHEIPEMPPHVVGILSLRGQLLPLADLSQYLGQQEHPYAIDDSVLVLGQGSPVLGVMVSQVFDVVMLPHPESGLEGHQTDHLTLGMAQWQENVVTILNLDALLAIAQAPPRQAKASFFPQATAADQVQLQVRADQLRGRSETAETQDLMPLAVIQLGPERLAIPVETIREFTAVRRVTPIPCCPPHILGNMNLRGEILTLVDIRQVLQLPPGGMSDLSQAIVVDVDGIVTGIAVDAVFDVIDVPATAITPIPVAAHSGRDEYLRGMVTFQDQSVSLLDLAKLLTSQALVVNSAVS